MQKLACFIFAALCVFISFYPVMYLVNGDQFGLLTMKTPQQLADMVWKAAFYTHILPGGIALLIGWAQFSNKWRKARPSFHRCLGRIYVVSALLSSLAGIYIGLLATGGPVAQMGFAVGGVVWFYSTLQGFLKIKKGDVLAHRNLMMYSYAACFGAVTLRFYMPVLMYLFQGDFDAAYRIVAWLAWAPNLVVAYLIVSRLQQKHLLTT